MNAGNRRRASIAGSRQRAAERWSPSALRALKSAPSTRCHLPLVADPTTVAVIRLREFGGQRPPYVPTIMAASARCDWMARSLFAASCCTSCPRDRSAFATMGCWPRRARGSSCQPHAWLCRCLHPTRRPLSRPRLSWRGWPRRMRACARVARLAGCGLSLRWRGLGDCLDRR